MHRDPVHPHPLSTTLARSWRSRATGEARVARIVTDLAAACRAHGDAIPTVVLDGLATIAVEEHAHAALCDELAAHYDPSVPPAPPREEIPIPLGSVEERGLMLISACCISESIASAYFERCWSTTTDPHARKVMHALFADEVSHAQLGWAYVASLSPQSSVRRALRASLDGLLERARIAWHTRIDELHATPIPEHGYPPAADCRTVVDEALAGLVRRGLDHLER
jgi:hypothetical protein